MGNELSYQSTLANDGNVSLTGVAVDDPRVTVACPGDSGSGITLSPGQTVNCQGTYTVAAGDLSQDWLANTAGATGAPARGVLPPVPDASAYVPLVPAPALTLTKTVSPAAFAAAGEVIAWTVTATNTGATSTAIANVDITDPATPLTCTVDSALVSLPVVSLAAGKSIVCTSAHQVTQAEVDAGLATNAATVTADTPPTARYPLTDSAQASAIGPEPAPSLTVSK